MRTLGVCLVLLATSWAGDAVQAVDDDTAAQAIKEFDQAFKTKDLEAKQNAVYNLHDVPHDLVLKKLEKLLKHKNPQVRNVAALAVGGQGHNLKRAGSMLMRMYVKDFRTAEVLASVIEAMAELKFLGYWPKVKPALKDDRSAVVIRVLDLLGVNKDWRSIPTLLKMYKVAMPKRVSWKTGEVKVDTGAAGDKDQKAAEAAFNKKYGRGGSKEKRKAQAKARAFDERNFAVQLRKCVKAITGEDFDTSLDFEDWYVENYVRIARLIAEMEGKNPDTAAAKARTELPALKAKIEEERKKLEEELEEQRKKNEKKSK